MRLYCFVASFAAGVVMQSGLPLPLSVALFAAFIGAAIFVYVAVRVEPALRGRMLIVPIVLIAFGLGLARMFASEIDRPSALDGFDGEKITAYGVVVAEPDMRDDHAKLQVKLSSIGTDEAETAVGGEAVLASVPTHPAFEYGDLVKIEGKLSRPKSFDDGFDYASYLKKDGIEFVVSYAEAALVRKGGGNAVRRALFAFKREAAEMISSAVPEPESSLVVGTLLGMKNSLGRRTLDEFKAAGLTHILVLSGYNVALVAEGATKVFSFLPRSGGATAGAASIVLFALMAGGTASVVRASVCAGLALLARFSWRRYDASRALAIAGFAMAMIDPASLAYDPSFALSFLAAFSLVLVAPEVSKRIAFVPKRLGLRETVATSLSAQLVVLPYLLVMSGTLSLVSLAANVLVLPAVPGIMLFGALTGALAFASKALSLAPGILAYGFALYVLSVTKFFASLPLSSIGLSFPAWGAAIWYAAYAAILVRLKRGKPADSGEPAPSFDVSRAYEIVG